MGAPPQGVPRIPGYPGSSQQKAPPQFYGAAGQPPYSHYGRGGPPGMGGHGPPTTHIGGYQGNGFNASGGAYGGHSAPGGHQ